MLIIKRSKKLLALFLPFLLIFIFTGCNVDKKIYEKNGSTQISEVTVKPGEYKDITVKLVVDTHGIDTKYPELKTMQTEHSMPEIKYYVVDKLISPLPSGFNLKLISLDGKEYNKPIGKNGEIIRVEKKYNPKSPSYTITYTLRIENNQHENYLKTQDPNKLEELFNKEYCLTTLSEFLPCEDTPPEIKKHMTDIKVKIPVEKKSIKIKTGAAGKISPVLETVTVQNGIPTAHWGYQNDNNFRITLTEENSKIISGTVINDAKAPLVFEPGRVKDVFKPQFSSEKLVWYVKGPDGQGRTSTASYTKPVEPAKADLKISLSAIKDAKPGDVIQYNINVENIDKATAEGVKIFTQLPKGTSFLNDDNSGWKLENGKYVYDLGKVAAGEKKAVVLKVKVNNPFEESSMKVAASFKAETITEEAKLDNNTAVWETAIKPAGTENPPAEKPEDPPTENPPAQNPQNPSADNSGELPVTGGIIETELLVLMLGILTLGAGMFIKIYRKNH
ncbi:hypothetical protein [Clostridium swellfunianum]|uniref:hypothetical protein n=1 Tax=Clostridium swellfunianum TaxID=1367462 RepID=UPI002030C9D6